MGIGILKTLENRKFSFDADGNLGMYKTFFI